ncbi:MAG: PaaI family thioesterase [Acidimicrobiia bacterium]
MQTAPFDVPLGATVKARSPPEDETTSLDDKVRKMWTVIDEPVRGAIGDLRALQSTGLEGARRYVRGELPGPPISRLFGLHPTDYGLGKSTYSMPITRWLEDAFGLVWAGAFALVADAPLGAAIYTGLPPGKIVTTSELNLSFVRPCTRETGNIVGRAISIHQGRQVGLAAVEIADQQGRQMGYGTTRCLILDVSVDPATAYPEPATGPNDPPDPYLREAPGDGYLDLESVINGKPIELQQRLIAGEVTPNYFRLFSPQWGLTEPGLVVGQFPTSPWFSAGGPALYGGVLAWMAEAAMGSAVYSTIGPGEVFATLDMNVRFIRPALVNSGNVTITSQVQHAGRRLRIASSDLIGSDGKRVAMATCSALVVPGGVSELMRGRRPDELLQA